VHLAASAEIRDGIPNRNMNTPAGARQPTHPHHTTRARECALRTHLLLKRHLMSLSKLLSVFFIVLRKHILYNFAISISIMCLIIYHIYSKILRPKFYLRSMDPRHRYYFIVMLYRRLHLDNKVKCICRLHSTIIICNGTYMEFAMNIYNALAL